MTDIVDTLRMPLDWTAYPEDFFKEAADEIERLRDQVWRMSRNGADLTGFTPTRLLMRQLFEDMGTTLTLDIGPFGDGGSDDSVNIGPHAGFTSDCLVLSFAAGTNQHGFSPADAPAVRQLIQAVLGWLDYIEARQKEEQGR